MAKEKANETEHDDYVRVVRCANCIDYVKGLCTRWNIFPGDSGYCWKGESNEQ